VNYPGRLFIVTDDVTFDWLKVERIYCLVRCQKSVDIFLRLLAGA